MRVNRRSILIVSAALLATPMAVAAAPSAQAAPGIVVREIVADGPAVVNDVAAGVEVNLQFKVLANTLASFTNNVIGTTNGPGQALIQIVGPNGSPTIPATPVYSNALSSLSLTPGTWTIRLVPIDAADASARPGTWRVGQLAATRSGWQGTITGLDAVRGRAADV